MPNSLAHGQSPYESSGYLMDEPHAVEITLCSQPAVAGAKFLMLRNIAPTQGQPDQVRKMQMPIRKSDKLKRQVFGYVSLPWLEDWYGDVMDPNSIEYAANSFLNNLQQGNTQGNGVGENHTEFWDNAYVCQSVVDYEGSIAGVPGGWWVGVQITDPTVWDKVISNQYTGFSLGSMVRFVSTRNESFLENLWKSMPDLISAQSKRPTKGKCASLNTPDTFGYPTDKSAYADPDNNKYPIDTRSRAYATLRYVLQAYESEGYSIDELKFVVRRMLAAIASYGDEVPVEVLGKVGLNKQSVIEHAGESGLKIQTSQNPKEESTMADNLTLSPVTQQAINDAVSEQIKPVFQTIDTKLNSLLKGQTTTETPAATTGEAQTTATIDTKPGANPTVDPTTTPAQDSVIATAQAVLAILKEQGFIQSTPNSAPAPAAPAVSTSLQTADVAVVVAKAAAQAVADAMGTKLNEVTTAMQSISSRIDSIPIPRSSQLKTMSKGELGSAKQALAAALKAGKDVNTHEASQLGFDMSLATVDEIIASAGLTN